MLLTKLQTPANTFRKMLDLSEVKWNEDVEVPKTEEGASHNTNQTSLSDFLN